MGKINKSKWNIENINEWCLINAKGYSVFEISWIEKSYQKQLWVLMKCPNKNHEPYLICWNKFYSHGRRCSKCDYERRNITEWNYDKVIEFY